MFGKSEAPPPPNYAPIAAASGRQARLAARLGQDQLAWAKKQYASDSKITKRVTGRFLKIMSANQKDAARDRARYERIYQPLEKDLVKDAETYSSKERIDRNMGRAEANVGQAFDAARDAALRQLEGYGVNPSATRFKALDLGTRIDEAAAKVGAGEMAREQTEATGRALRSEALNIGRGYPGQVAGAYGTSMGAGTGAVGAAATTTGTGATTMGTAPQYMGLGQGALNLQGNLAHMGYGDTLAGWQATQEHGNPWASALGTVAGVGTDAALRFYGMDKGGAVPIEVSPSKGAVKDDVHARLTAGEFIVPKEAVEWYGQKHFVGLVSKAREERTRALPV